MPPKKEVDLQQEIRLIREEEAKAKAEAEATAMKKVQKVVDPLLSELEHRLADVHNIIVTLDENIQETNSTGQLTYLKDERFKQSLDFIKKRLNVSSSGVSANGDKKRVGKADLEKAILEAIGSGEVTHAEIKAHPTYIKVYSDIGKEPANAFAKLDSMIEEGTLNPKKGEGRKATYSIVVKKK